MDSSGEGEIKIDVDPNKTSWIGSWKFSLNANSPNKNSNLENIYI